jgi:hypothetical protein
MLWYANMSLIYSKKWCFCFAVYHISSCAKAPRVARPPAWASKGAKRHWLWDHSSPSTVKSVNLVTLLLNHEKYMYEFFRIILRIESLRIIRHGFFRLSLSLVWWSLPHLNIKNCNDRGNDGKWWSARKFWVTLFFRHIYIHIYN